MKQIKIYKFSELSEQAKSIAIKNQQDYIRKKAEIKNYLHYEEMKKACIFKVIKDTKNSTRCAGYKKENSFTKIDTLTLDKLFYVLETVKNRVCQILYKLLEGWYNQFLDEKAIIAALEMYPFTEDGISIHVNIVP